MQKYNKLYAFDVTFRFKNRVISVFRTFDYICTAFYSNNFIYFR